MEKEKFQEFLNTADSQALTNVVLIYRVLGSMKDEAKLCMIELMKRKQNGDVFDFKSFLEENSKKYKININIQAPKTIKQKISSTVMEGIIGGMMSDIFNTEKSIDTINDDD